MLSKIKILFWIISTLFSVAAFAQAKGLELRLEIFKDTIELLHPFEYCMCFSNNANDSIETNAFPWENYKKPWLEVKALGELKWKRLYKSEVELGMDHIVKSIYGPLNCWDNPRKSLKIPPKAHYSRASIYYPLWGNVSQIGLRPKKKYKIRLAFNTGNKIGVIRSKPVVIHVKNSTSDIGISKGLLQKGLNTEQLFEPWNYCSLQDSIKAKFTALQKENPDTYFAKWISVKTLECKFYKLENNRLLEYFQKIEIAKSLLTEQRLLIEKLLQQGFYPKNIILGEYSSNLDKWLFDIDFHDREIEWINKMLEPKQPVCSCK